MLLRRAHAIAFMLIGAASLIDGSRIAYYAREGANFDAIGPDRYLLALGVVMLTAGLWRLLSRTPDADALRGPNAPPVAITPRLVLTLALLAGFAGLAPVIGFSLACLLFLTLQLRLQSSWPWWKSAAVAAAITLAFHVAFVGLADMPLPKGYIWD